MESSVHNVQIIQERFNLKKPKLSIIIYYSIYYYLYISITLIYLVLSLMSCAFFINN